MKTEAFPCIWYVCPTCSAENTVRVNKNLAENPFKCKECKSAFTVPEILEEYGPDCLETGKVNLMAVEFICDECGGTNLLFPTTILEHDQEYGEGGRTIIGGKLPQFGLCEECNAGFDLTYVLPKE